MALFSRQSKTQAPAAAFRTAPAKHHLVIPRLSEKANMMAGQNKHVFRIEGGLNKVELKKYLEKTYGVTVAFINMIRMEGKIRNFGRRAGKTSDFKKAIVTLTPDSKKLELGE
jgi:large subunit ribosomal protein L23